MIIFAAVKFLVYPFPNSFMGRLRWYLLNLKYGSFFRVRTIPLPQIDRGNNPWSVLKKHLHLVIEYYKPKNLLKAPIVCHTMFVKNAPERNAKSNQINLEIKQIARDWSRCFEENQNNLENWVSTFGLFLEKAEELGPRFTDRMNSSVPVEFGPGLGAAAMLYSKYFKTKVVLFDLPETTILRKIIFESLSKNGFDENRYEQYSDIDSLMAKKPNVTSFISTWAFTETPLELREKFFPLLKDSMAILIVSNNHFGNVDNFSYLKNLSKKLPYHSHFSCDLSFLQQAPSYQKKHQLHLYLQ